MSTPELVSVRLVEGGGLQLTFAEGAPRVVRLTHGDLSRLELWAEAESDIDAEIAAKRADLDRLALRVRSEIEAGGKPGDVTIDDLATANTNLRADVKRLAARNRADALEVWRGIAAICELWPEPDDTPGILSVRLLGEWRAAIEGDPFARSPGQPLTAQVHVTSVPSANNSQP